MLRLPIQTCLFWAELIISAVSSIALVRSRATTGRLRANRLRSLCVPDDETGICVLAGKYRRELWDNWGKASIMRDRYVAQSMDDARDKT